MFPVYIDSANITSITRLAETDRIHELGMQLLRPHYHLIRASLTWLLLSHADELPNRLASSPVAFAAELQHVASISNAMMAKAAGFCPPLSSRPYIWGGSGVTPDVGTNA